MVREPYDVKYILAWPRGALALLGLARLNARNADGDAGEKRQRRPLGRVHLVPPLRPPMTANNFSRSRQLGELRLNGEGGNCAR